MTQAITFDKYGLDSDTAPELNKAFPFLKNVRILATNDGNDGSLTTCNGNDLVAHNLQSGNNVVIGYFEDKINQKGYAFLYNDTGLHSILQYDEVTSTIADVFIDRISYTGQTSGSILNFQRTNLITGGKVVELDKDNHLLYWTDNWVSDDGTEYNEPRKLNIEAAIYFFSQL